MHIADQRDERLTLNQVAKHLGVHIGTVYRWSFRGVRGRRLQTFLIGGRRYVALQDLERFLQTKESPKSTSDQKRSNTAQERLRSFGIESPKGMDGAA